MPRAEKWTKKRKEQKRMEAEYCPARRLGSSTMAGRVNGIAIHCAKCAFDLDEVELDLQATTEGLKEAVRACEGDIQKLCGSTQPGEGRIAACLAVNRSSVSAGCVDAVGKLDIK